MAMFAAIPVVELTVISSVAPPVVAEAVQLYVKLANAVASLAKNVLFLSNILTAAWIS